jgi:PAS domain-containing protein
MGLDKESRPNAVADSKSHATRSAPEPEGSLLKCSMPIVGKIKNGNAASLFRSDMPDPPEWESVRLEIQIRQLLESMVDPTVVHDSGVIIGFNQRVPDLLSCPAEKILWRRLSKFIEPVSLRTFTRWIEATEQYTILVSGVHARERAFLLRLEAVASLLCPGGRRVAVVTLAEFAAEASREEHHESA